MIEKRFNIIIRILVAFVAVFWWVVSINFSANGFSFSLPQYIWVGYGLGLSGTVLELMFNEKSTGNSLVLRALGILAYIFGVSTNLLGVWLAQGQPNYLFNPMPGIVNMSLSLIIEVGPEPMLLWALGIENRDFIRSLFKTRVVSTTIKPVDNTMLVTNSMHPHPIAHQRAHKHQQPPPP